MDTIKKPHISAKVWQLKCQQLTKENEGLVYQNRKQMEDIADKNSIIKKLEGDKK